MNKTCSCLFVLLFVISVVNCTTRNYYVSIEEVEWDYAPLGINAMNNVTVEEDSDASVFCARTETTIGSVYKKALMFEYTDATFTVKKERPEEEEYLGILGPTLYAEVGDIMNVYFKNLATFNYTLHPHGVLYTKDSEGAKYPDNSTIGDFVRPGDTFVYVWPVPARSGPAPGDFNVRSWIYHSHISETRDSNSGSVGWIIISRKGHAHPNGKPKGFDREYYVVVTNFDENLSNYLDDNINTFIGEGNEHLKEEDDFIESNLMHSLNGYVFGNIKNFEVTQKERVLFAFGGMGTEIDIHTLQIRGFSFLTVDRIYRNAVFVSPAITAEALFYVDEDPGEYLYLCSVNDHFSGGMFGKVTVIASEVEFQPNLEKDYFSDYFDHSVGDNNRILVDTSNSNILTSTILYFYLMISMCFIVVFYI
eukprot:TRINITY_DN13728_c0_g1_i1.p1 TRINITY_DN13728_c0_g1~~TRINITY_DN13728_c0_g1_i1.p1  ORF type:complete len:421 (-),score=126.22 TRINITY_DN13728_c0_g1_i1:192-1454(-)